MRCFKQFLSTIFGTRAITPTRVTILHNDEHTTDGKMTHFRQLLRVASLRYRERERERERESVCVCVRVCVLACCTDPSEEGRHRYNVKNNVILTVWAGRWWWAVVAGWIVSLPSCHFFPTRCGVILPSSLVCDWLSVPALSRGLPETLIGSSAAACHVLHVRVPLHLNIYRLFGLTD